MAAARRQRPNISIVGSTSKLTALGEEVQDGLNVVGAAVVSWTARPGGRLLIFGGMGRDATSLPLWCFGDQVSAAPSLVCEPQAYAAAAVVGSHAALFFGGVDRTALHGMIVDENGPFGGYIAIPPYVHMAIEHVQTDWKDAIGPWSTEGLEASNREWRYALEHLAANDLNGFEHALKVMWLRTHPTLAELVDREPRYQVCSVCATRGHNRRTCEERSLVGANGGEAGD